MKALRLHGIGDLRLEEVKKPVPTGDEILMKIGACGICGSDLPRVYDLGAHVYPLTIGHEFAGTIVEVGNPADEDLLGKKAAVFPLIPCGKCEACRTGKYCQCSHYNYLGSRCDGGFAEYCLIPSRWNLVPAKDERVSMEELCMVEPICVAQHAVRRGQVTGGEQVVVFGAGPIGILSARWAEIFGAKKVILVDIDEIKVEFARGRGFTVINSRETDGVKAILELTGGRGVDVAIEGTGTGSCLNSAVECVRTGGRIVLLGNPHCDTTLELKNHSSILRKEILLSGVWNSYYEELPLNEWSYSVEMLESGRLEAAALISHRVGLDGLKELFDNIHERKITICKAIYSAEENEKE
ncbi:galactitol-1-phosphate 5-dehydrogenase [Anaerosacchariphilus sp. NSJ-68]|uniref:Galactitol-1-phosphate 5-dehydrogenase n=2 Tax=Lachnospiraceae TaxID=186803 RepID=A0A923LDA1_9FIRM|nr:MULTISPECIES: galactitol-1-phosphate 5-dehydrogenase [Lachnospiraceae]MBC5660453.1 galactitol-1-phosphate 5-dehydrogenase [Anaerosacchariphilus hominis]MBC5697699.1 galactitol-1-phosphate 5-dehydrogenase [Roseburia difficilis]